MPDWRHSGFLLGLAGPLVSLFTMLAVRREPGAGAMRGFPIVIFIGQIVLLAIMFGVGELVTRANVGIWQRINSASASRGWRWWVSGCCAAHEGWTRLKPTA